MPWTGALRIKARDIESVRARARAHIASRPRPSVCLMSGEVHSEVSLTVQRSFGVVLPRP